MCCHLKPPPQDMQPSEFCDAQAFEQELESLPGCYSPPGGCVLLLLYQPDECSPETAVGCVAVRPLHTNSSASRTPTPGPRQPTFQQQQNQQQPPPPLPPGADMQDADIDSTCEMKRLFVLSEHTGQGCGRALAAAAVAAAQEAGYARMVLDTLDTLTAANRLYEGLGFVRRDAYYHNPLPGVVYWAKDL